jgi:hypothetical protein
MFYGLLLSGLPGVLSAGSWAGGFRGGFRGHVGLSFLGFADRRTRARCGEAGDRSICRQPAGAG